MGGGARRPWAHRTSGALAALSRTAACDHRALARPCGPAFPRAFHSRRLQRANTHHSLRGTTGANEPGTWHTSAAGINRYSAKRTGLRAFRVRPFTVLPALATPAGCHDDPPRGGTAHTHALRSFRPWNPYHRRRPDRRPDRPVATAGAWTVAHVQPHPAGRSRAEERMVSTDHTCAWGQDGGASAHLASPSTGYLQPS